MKSKNPDLARIKVKDRMSTDLVTVHPDMTLREAAKVLAKAKVSGAPVLDVDGRVYGVISITDVVRHQAKQAKRGPAMGFYALGDFGLLDTSLLEPELLNSTPVARVMSTRAVTIAPNASLLQAADLMSREGIHRVLVVEEEKLLGIVSSMDILRALAGRGPR
jgi:CBS domain-containing protein